MLYNDNVKIIKLLIFISNLEKYKNRNFFRIAQTRENEILQLSP